jgi:predicted transcriptional regulator
VTRMVRIHYEIDDELHRRAKSIAALNGETLKALIEKAITEYVERAEQPGNLSGRARDDPEDARGP